MPASLTTFKATLEKLIRRFESDRTHYLSKNYSEAQARVDFISPFFKALGWDVENEEGLAHHAREVVVEAAQDTGGRPDYSFRVAGQTKFFVEAKAPCEELDAARHILQAKSYAYSTKQILFVVLTDFEEFRFYDATIRPDERKPEEGLLLKLKYKEYLAKADKLWEFSRDRVVAGSLEALLPRDRRTQRLRIPVDESFLDEMTGWREELAKNVYKNNPDLTAKQLNEIVQRLLDRIVFIRIAEDRHVIEKSQLRDAVEEWKARGGKFHIFEWLNDLFHRINDDFNGEIFKPHLSEEIKIDSEVLARIIEHLYPPKSPYRFDAIGVELLGSIYERYLGKTIRPTAKQVRVEDKPEVRKAEGVYYTPKYIVDYIVKNTVGKIIEGKTPKQIERIRILDPACGSGSFLIGAFQCLIDYHIRYLTAHPKEAETHPLFPDVIRDSNGEPRLSVIRKAKILKNNLFGVDIDPQAVEITMMSLYLKALEGERSQLPPKQHLLPELKYNIICGNSLIGPDIYGQGLLFADEERDRINAFDWNSETVGFGRIMKEGRFDCVIGNPPYVSFGLRGTGKAEGPWAEYIRAKFVSAEYKLSLYAVFLEKGVSVLRQSGRLGFITPDSFLLGRFFSRLRDYVLAHSKIDTVALFQEDFWASGVVGRPTIIILERSDAKKAQREHLVRAVHFPTAESTEKGGKVFSYPQAYFESTPLKRFRLFFSAAEFSLVTHVESGAIKLRDVVSFASGLIGLKGQKSIISTRREGADWHRGLLSGGDISRYAVLYRGAYICIDELKLKSGYKDAKYFEPKLFMRQTGDSLIAAYDDSGLLCLNNLHVGNLRDTRYDLRFVAALLNSSLLNCFYRLISLESGRILAQTDIETIELLPIPAAKAEIQAQLAGLAKRMAELAEKKHSGKLAPSHVDRLDREIAATDAEIDDLVFKLYGITDSERKIIEASQP